MFRMNLPVIAPFVTSLLFVQLMGCESSTDPVDPVPELLEASGMVGASGGTLTSDNGKLSISFPPGALANDTQITIREADPSASQTRLGDFEATKVIEMEPSGLQLQADATLTYETDLDVTSITAARSSALKDGHQKTDDFELALGILLGEESSSIPNQKIRYRISDGLVRFQFEFDYVDDMVIGPPIAKDNPNEGDELSTLRLGLFLNSPTSVINEPFQPTLTIGMMHPNHMSASNYIMDPPTLPFDWNGETPASDPMDVGGGRVEYTLTPEYTATEDGDFSFDLDFGFDMTIPNPDLLDLPADIEPTVGSIEVDIESRPLQIHFQLCQFLPCFEGFIETGMASHEGLSVNYLDESDVAPDSVRAAWLYVSGSDGLQYYRINRRANGEIFSTYFMGDLGPIGSLVGCVPVSHRDGAKIARGLFSFGDLGGWRTNWFEDLQNPDNSGYGIQLGISFKRVHDAVSYGGLDQVHGYCFTNGSAVLSIEYYAPAGMFAGEETLTLVGQSFENANGGPTTAFVNPVTNGILVVMDGTPSQVWFHDRVDQYETGSMVTTVGSDPRRMRGVGSVIGVTNFGSNTVSILTWDGGSAVANHGQVAVGTGPFGLDAIPLANGNVGFVCTSETDNTYNYIEATTSGSVVSNISAALPEFCSGAKHAVFLPGPKVYIVLACQDGEISFIETTLTY